ncbi:MAG: recombinase family protein [Christensenella sp.]
MIYAYIRVSTAEQNEDRQMDAMKQYGISKKNYFVEKASGKNTKRPQFMALMSKVVKGDVIHIHDFSRLARSTTDLLSIVEALNCKGVTLVSNKESIDTSTPTGKLMLTMIGAINEFERTNLLERQAEGIAAARERGKRWSRFREIPDGYYEIVKQVNDGVLSVVEAIKELGISRQTWYNWRAII